MNSYRLHINSDERGPWRCLVRAETVDAAIRYGEQVFPGSDITVTRLVSPPQKKAGPEPKLAVESSGVWGFSRAELALIAQALRDYAWHKEECTGEAGLGYEASTLANRIQCTLDLESVEDTGPF